MSKDIKAIIPYYPTPTKYQKEDEVIWTYTKNGEFTIAFVTPWEGTVGVAATQRLSLVSKQTNRRHHISSITF